MTTLACATACHAYFPSLCNSAATAFAVACNAWPIIHFCAVSTAVYAAQEMLHPPSKNALELFRTLGHARQPPCCGSASEEENAKKQNHRLIKQCLSQKRYLPRKIVQSHLSPPCSARSRIRLAGESWDTRPLRWHFRAPEVLIQVEDYLESISAAEVGQRCCRLGEAYCRLKARFRCSGAGHRQSLLDVSVCCENMSRKETYLAAAPRNQLE